MLRRPALWMVLVLAAAACGAFGYVYFDRAFPLVSLDIKMDREGALAAAAELAERHGWGPDGYRQAASFSAVPEWQEFVELEGGGKERFRELMTSGLVYPYRWQVLHFAELQTREMSIYLSPGGRAYAFRERVPEDEAGAALESDEALLVAERGAVADWDVTLDAFERVETSQSARPSGRVDHTFTYERVGERLGAATLRMRLVVSGDRLTELVHYLEVPEAFRRRFDNMRADKTSSPRYRRSLCSSATSSSAAR